MTGTDTKSTRNIATEQLLEVPVEIPIEIPFNALSTDTLSAVVDEFILRNGTDYGAEEIEHSVKRTQLLQQIQSGKVRIVFDATTESLTLTVKEK
jgi:uncharacterized protein